MAEGDQELGLDHTQRIITMAGAKGTRRAAKGAAKGRTKAIVSVMVQWSRPRTTPRQPGRTAAGPLSDVTANKEKILSPSRGV